MPAMTTRAMESLFLISVFASADASGAASVGSPDRLCTRLRVDGLDSRGCAPRTLPGREPARLGERERGLVWMGVLLDVRRWESSDFVAAAAETLSPPTRRAAMRRVAAASKEVSAVFRFLVGGSCTVSRRTPRFCGRKMAGIGSPSSEAGDSGGEGRFAGSNRSDEMASART